MAERGHCIGTRAEDEALHGDCPYCAYCEAGIDRTPETGGRTFIHVLTRGVGGQMLKWRPCGRNPKAEPDNRPAEVIIREDRDAWPH